MKTNKFEYFLNTILFFIYKEEVWSNRIFDKIIWKCFFVVSKFLSLESYYHKRRNIFRKDSNYQNYMYGKKTGQSIGLANHWLGFSYSAYSAFFIRRFKYNSVFVFVWNPYRNLLHSCI